MWNWLVCSTNGENRKASYQSNRRRKGRGVLREKTTQGEIRENVWTSLAAKDN
jgi:hypothetical protein